MIEVIGAPLDAVAEGGSRFNSHELAGRTGLVHRCRLGGVEAALHSANHAVLARFGNRIAHAPCKTGPPPDCHFDLLPANCSLRWDDGAEHAGYLTVFLPMDVVDECSDQPSAPADPSARLGVADPKLWLMPSKPKHAVECPDNLRLSYHGQFLRLLAAELALRHGSATPPGAARGGLSGSACPFDQRPTRQAPCQGGGVGAASRPGLPEQQPPVRGVPANNRTGSASVSGGVPNQSRKAASNQGRHAAAEVALAVGYSDQSWQARQQSGAGPWLVGPDAWCPQGLELGIDAHQASHPALLDSSDGNVTVHHRLSGS